IYSCYDLRIMRIFHERPFLFISLTYAAGIVLGTLTRYAIAWPWFGLITLASFAILIFICHPKIFLPIAFLFILSAGACSYQISQIVPAQDVSNREFHGRGSLQGRVVSEVDQKAKGKKEIISFTLRAESWWRKQDKALVTGKVRVTLLNAGTVPSFGDEVRIRGNLSFPKSAVNPGEFDYRSYLEKQGIRAAFLGFGKKAITTLDSRLPAGRQGFSAPADSLRRARNDNQQPWVWLIRKIFDLRRAIHDRVYQLVRAPERDILLSLITGERTNIPREITDDFVRTATVHVLAISGFQVSLVAGATFLILRGFGCSTRIAAFISSVVLILYIPLAGWQLPVQRAGIMGLVILGAVILSKSNDVLSSLCFAFFILLLIRPENLYSVAFQLSFLSVISIMGFMPVLLEKFTSHSGDAGGITNAARQKMAYGLKVLFFTTLSATLGTWPLVLYYFHVVSFTGILANFLVVPVTTAALFSSLFVLGVSTFWFDAAQVLMQVPSLCIWLAIQVVHWLAGIPAGYIYLPSPHWILVCLYYVFLVGILIGMRGTKVKRREVFPVHPASSSRPPEADSLPAEKRRSIFLEF
ncbi:MAG: ComEC/Rec2 family competence protein, partial [Candidatus Omnitrophica bacterium]|nr:ComEC/Rec2 family competence protein [Candidatus Omnitrophota bacterium]